jgi:uncharacterized membrane protein YjjP (DUF1212 family)
VDLKKRLKAVLRVLLLLPGAWLLLAMAIYAFTGHDLMGGELWRWMVGAILAVTSGFMGEW